MLRQALVAAVALAFLAMCALFVFGRSGTNGLIGDPVVALPLPACAPCGTPPPSPSPCPTGVAARPPQLPLPPPSPSPCPTGVAATPTQSPASAPTPAAPPPSRESIADLAAVLTACVGERRTKMDIPVTGDPWGFDGHRVAGRVVFCMASHADVVNVLDMNLYTGSATVTASTALKRKQVCARRARRWRRAGCSVCDRDSAATTGQGVRVRD